MGIQITQKGRDHINEKLKAEGVGDERQLTRIEAMRGTLIHFLQMKEGTIYANDKEIEEAKARGRKTGHYHSGKAWVEVFAPEGRVVGGWHRYILRELPFKATREQSDLLFKLGQEIIQGKEAGLRL